MSLVVQEDVVQLQVTVDDALFVQEVQSDTNFSSVKSEWEERGTGSSIRPSVSTGARETFSTSALAADFGDS